MGNVRNESESAMLTRDLLRKHQELAKRFKEIQTRFENAKTDAGRKRAFKEMRQLSDETHFLLNRDHLRLGGA
jgi:hypothetical protein